MEKDEKTRVRKARNELVVKHNDLLRKTRYTLSATEQKIIIYLISLIKADDTELKEIEINVLDFCKIANIEASGEAYNRIKDTIKELADKSWWIPSGEKKERLYRWISEAEIEQRNGTIKIELGKYLAPYLLDLRRDFVQYELINILALRSRYSIRLYELLKSYLWKQKWTVSVEELRDILEIGEKYKQFKDFKKWVLKPSVEEINDNTNLEIAFETITKGRKVTGIDFTIEEKYGYQTTMKLIQNQEERLG